jgi:hypothetical protein
MAASMPDRSVPGPALAAHLLRGAIGFGLIVSTFVLIPSFGAPALLLLVPGAVALRGCPTCWLLGLIQTLSAGRIERACTDTGCAPRHGSREDRAPQL